MNIYVGFLPEDFDDQALGDKFAEFGEVLSAKVIRDRDTGKSKGFGFVEMKNDKEGQTAIDTLQNWVKSDGRTVKVNIAQDKNSNPRSSSGGFQGRRNNW